MNEAQKDLLSKNNKRNVKNDGYFDSAPVHQIWNEHLEGHANWGHQLWNILMFQSWLEKYS